MIKNDFIINIPQENLSEDKSKNKGSIDIYKGLIKNQYNELLLVQDYDIDSNNKEKLEKMVFAAEDLIENCMNDNYYSGNRDEYFVNLTFICHKLSLKIETYKLQETINKLQETSKQIEERQKNTEKENGNLVYNILGFIASFSIVSAAVVAIGNIKDTSNIALFMLFAVFILITTLIGLNNFYKVREGKSTILQNNYFLWWILLIVIVLLIGYNGINYIKENKGEFCEAIGRGIGTVWKQE